MPIEFSVDGKIARVQAADAAEAKLVVKELKLKKKEIQLQKKEITGKLPDCGLSTGQLRPG